MRNLKKLLVVCLLFAVCFSVAPTSQAFARDEVAAVNAIQPRFSNLQTFALGFGVDDSDGAAIADFICYYYKDWTDSVTVRVEFQRYTSAGWTTFQTFTTSSTDNPHSDEHVCYVSSGYSYRAVAYVDLYSNGSIVETVRAVSDADYY